ncbi:32 kDa apolipoprotein [Operophtera brumata]|uniref:32 kDa apolipoprotein n=1 Tax=Operophtera brumata TaxID=104452 RepID=A0A0L7LHP7_OPEBR|nr:32 kDa apolipoprotein [Operophtera brumata]
MSLKRDLYVIVLRTVTQEALLASKQHIYESVTRGAVPTFLGSWYEAERYFTVSELGSRCVTTNYAATPEGRIIVSNEITNSL